MKRLLLCMWSVVALFSNLQAQSKEPVLRLEIQYDSIGLQEQVQLKYIFENAQSVSFSPSVFEGFELAGGPYQSSQFSMVNGVTSSSVSYTYILRPTAIGTFLIESQTVYISGQSMKTPEAQIVVVRETLHQEQPMVNSPFGGGGRMPGFGFDDRSFDELFRQQEEIWKRHQDFFNNSDSLFNNPNMLFNFPRQFGPDLNEMFKNWGNTFQFPMPPMQQPKKPEEKTYKL